MKINTLLEYLPFINFYHLTTKPDYSKQHLLEYLPLILPQIYSDNCYSNSYLYPRYLCAVCLRVKMGLIVCTPPHSHTQTNTNTVHTMQVKHAETFL